LAGHLSAHLDQIKTEPALPARTPAPPFAGEEWLRLALAVQKAACRSFLLLLVDQEHFQHLANMLDAGKRR
jgi:hypothetical protein